jgi:predicted transcriptional regulator
MKNRSRTEIISMILNSVNSGATKTKIMYKAYLSYAQLKEYLVLMEKNELIRYEDGTQVYRITEKGIKLMRLCEEVGDMITPIHGYEIAKVSI